MSDRSEWVEIIGLPGCGKTTFVRNNMDYIQAHYHVVESRSPTVLSRIRTRLAPRLNDLPADLAHKIAYRLSFRPLLSPAKPLFLFDAGFYQLILEYLIKTDFADADKLMDALKALPVAGKLIHAYGDLDTALERELQRPDRRYPALDKAALAASYKKAEEVMEKHIFPLARAVYPANLAEVTDIKEVLQQ